MWERLRDFLELLRDYFAVYTWGEFWIVVGSALTVVAFWVLFARLLGISDDFIRPVSIWALVIVLTAGAAGVDFLRKRQAE